MAEREEPYEKAKTLPALSDHVGRDEGRIGKLKSFKIDGDYTVATFVTGPSYPPARWVKLQEVQDDNAPPPSGFTLVCRGECWDAGKKKKAIAVRKKA